MNGFFSKQQLKSDINYGKTRLSCHRCGLYKEPKNPKMQPYGNFKKKVMVVGSAPGEWDDMRGKPWQGIEGRFLRKTLLNMGVDLFEDCVCVNAINCRPIKDGEEHSPLNYEIDCCRKIVLGHIKRYKPKVIIALGPSAITSIVGVSWKEDLGRTRLWRGYKIPDQQLQCWVCPTFEPQYIIKQDRYELTNVWENDLRDAFELVDKTFPIWKPPKIHYVSDFSFLKTIRPMDTSSIDYETTGLKPHRNGHAIVCGAVAVDEEETFAFEMPIESKALIPFKEFLADENRKKVAHNMKYEHMWSDVILGVTIKGWEWDTMLAAHVLDNRTYSTSLKFQGYVKFGIPDYSSEISPYLRAVDDKDANSLNTLLQYTSTPKGMERTLKYCGTDTIVTHRLYLEQKKLFELLTLPF